MVIVRKASGLVLDFGVSDGKGRVTKKIDHSLMNRAVRLEASRKTSISFTSFQVNFRPHLLSRF